MNCLFNRLGLRGCRPRVELAVDAQDGRGAEVAPVGGVGVGKVANVGAVARDGRRRRLLERAEQLCLARTNDVDGVARVRQRPRRARAERVCVGSDPGFVIVFTGGDAAREEPCFRKTTCKRVSLTYGGPQSASRFRPRADRLVFFLAAPAFWKNPEKFWLTFGENSKNSGKICEIIILEKIRKNFSNFQ